MLHVVEAKSAGGFRLNLRFSDGVEGIADLSSLLWGPVFESLRESAAFARFRISPISGALEWDNGADLAPEALENLVAKNPNSNP
jgi:hypothetical protein